MERLLEVTEPKILKVLIYQHVKCSHSQYTGQLKLSEKKLFKCKMGKIMKITTLGQTYLRIAVRLDSLEVRWSWHVQVSSK